MATRHLTRAEAKKALGDMPERTFAQWCARGLPVEGELDAARYPWPEVFRWLLDQKERRGREAAAPDSNINDSRKREAAARADLEAAHPLLEKGGVLIFDDISTNDGECGLITEWDDFMSKHGEEYFSCARMEGKGVAWAIKK